MDSSTITLTAALEAALRRAALYELEGGADELRGLLSGELAPDKPVAQPDEIDRARARVAHAGLLLDELGYTGGEDPIASLTVPAAALQQVASGALDDLDAEIREPGWDPAPDEIVEAARVIEHLRALRAQVLPAGALA